MFTYSKADCRITIVGPLLTFSFPGLLTSNDPHLFYGHDSIELKKLMDELGIVTVEDHHFCHRWFHGRNADNLDSHCHFRATKQSERENVECIFKFLHGIALMVEQGSYLSFTLNNYAHLKYYYAEYLNRFSLSHLITDIMTIGLRLEIENQIAQESGCDEEYDRARIDEYYQKSRFIYNEVKVSDLKKFVAYACERFPDNTGVQRIKEKSEKLVIEKRKGLPFFNESNDAALAGLNASPYPGAERDAFSLKNKHIIYTFLLAAMLAREGLSAEFILKSTLFILAIAAIPPHVFKEQDARLFAKSMKRHLSNLFYSNPAVIEEEKSCVTLFIKP